MRFAGQAIAVLAVLSVMLVACRRSADDQHLDRETLTGTVEEMADEVHRALGIDGRVELLGTRVEPCADGLGQASGASQAIAASRLERGAPDADDLGALLGDEFGADRVAVRDLTALESDARIGRQVTLISEQDGIDVTVHVRIAAGVLTATARTACA